MSTPSIYVPTDNTINTINTIFNSTVEFSHSFRWISFCIQNSKINNLRTRFVSTINEYCVYYCACRWLHKHAPTAQQTSIAINTTWMMIFHIAVCQYGKAQKYIEEESRYTQHINTQHSTLHILVNSHAYKSLLIGNKI